MKRFHPHVLILVVPAAVVLGILLSHGIRLRLI